MKILLRVFVTSLGLLLAASCTLPQPGYRKVDQTTPAFKQAVAAETERQKSLGHSDSDAKEAATKTVVRRTIQEQKVQRKAQIVPLVEILEAFEKPRGCWAYTATTTSRGAEGKAFVTVERYDPSQPEELIWTLVSGNGLAPNDQAQADYRKQRLKTWKKAQSRAAARHPKSDQAKRSAVYANLEITTADVGEQQQTTYAFNREHLSMPLLGDIPPSRETYVAQEGILLSQTNTYFGSASLLAGTVKMDHFDSRADYTVVDPSLPPFVAKTVVHFRGSFFGTDTGEVDRETVYSDYRRVKCYEDRFEVRIGAPIMSDFVPEK